MDRNLLAMGVIFFQNSGIGILFVFLPVLSRSFTESLVDVGVMVGVFYMAQFLSSAYFGKVSDKRRERLLFIRAGFAICALAFGVSYFVQDSTHLFVSMVGTGAAAGIMTPAILAYVYESNSQKQKSAAVISFHTLGWLAGILVGGVISDGNVIFLVVSAMFMAGFGVSLRLKPCETRIEHGVSIIKVFMKNRMVYFSMLLRHFGAAAVFTILPLFLIETLGADIFQVSIVYVTNMVVSFAVMFLMASKIRLCNVRAFKIGVALSIVAFSSMLFANEWWEVVPFMAIIGVSWGLVYVGASLHLMANNPKSTSIGIFNSMISLGQIVGPLAAGGIAFGYGYEAVTWFMVGTSIIAIVLSAKIRG